ncbi:HEAT repeat domain-containing protein [Saccharopolyspora sp. ASAGF58]|uniref:HEAT repeat domain-containing protein n=1 Tax=Saccharopolyspora sp. ASAGF58 TaxID=2719023 RepID=UPI00143FE794|nr:HEAT repeat domain-containing protein [Saccharopolyspora sp. ASAGF58]QIZ38458.1 hypothetical protein FDZ84_32920 [Saccharopolyspora sp. ASAGF58]
MTEQSPISEAQERFRQAVSAHWSAIRSGTTRDADKHSETASQLVADAANASELLTPLLDDAESPQVRCAAATFLLNRGHADEAVPVLEALADDDDIGLVAEDADMALESWRSKNAE